MAMPSLSASTPEGATLAAAISDWLAPGRSSRNRRGLGGSATGAMFLIGSGSAGACHWPKRASSSGLISASVVSPTIKSVALSGRTQRW